MYLTPPVHMFSHSVIIQLYKIWVIWQECTNTTELNLEIHSMREASSLSMNGHWPKFPYLHYFPLHPQPPNPAPTEQDILQKSRHHNRSMFSIDSLMNLTPELEARACHVIHCNNPVLTNNQHSVAGNRVHVTHILSRLTLVLWYISSIQIQLHLLQLWQSEGGRDENRKQI